MGFDSKKELIRALGNRNLSSANGGARQQRHGMCLLNILCAADGAVAVQSKSAKKNNHDQSTGSCWNMLKHWFLIRFYHFDWYHHEITTFWCESFNPVTIGVNLESLQAKLGWLHLRPATIWVMTRHSMRFRWCSTEDFHHPEFAMKNLCFGVKN